MENMLHCGFFLLFYIGCVGVLKVFSTLFFVGGWVCFGFQLKHILAGLLCLEVSLIGLLIGVLASGVFLANYFFFIILSMGVCESALGMSLMLIYGRCYGNDFFSGLDSQKI
nr:NADH dehydrogenase subunit 4L [Catillopecten margaritatus]